MTAFEEHLLKFWELPGHSKTCVLTLMAEAERIALCASVGLLSSVLSSVPPEKELVVVLSRPDWTLGEDAIKEFSHGYAVILRVLLLSLIAQVLNIISN
jgi:hypothetical protein